MDAQLTAYQVLGRASKSSAALEAFEVPFLNSLTVVLDSSFVHRSRTLELKDGNPLNEVRMLCNSILQNRAILTADKTIKYNPSKAVLQFAIGQEIRMRLPDFIRLRDAFLAEIESKFR
jgi:hypothetical protein